MEHFLAAKDARISEKSPNWNEDRCGEETNALFIPALTFSPTQYDHVEFPVSFID